MSTLSKVRVVQDLARADGAGTATVAVYAGLVETAAAFFEETDDSVDQLHRDAVAIAGRREVPEPIVVEMGAWIATHWSEISTSASILDALDQVSSDPFPQTPAAVLAYRDAAEELALRVGECAAGVSWCGAVATARALRLYAAHGMENLDELAVDPVFATARSELSAEERSRLTIWVHDVWERIDEMASEVAS